MGHFVGIDVSKATLDLAALPDGEAWSSTNDDAGLQELVPRLLALAPSLVVLEATGGFEHAAAQLLDALLTRRAIGSACATYHRGQEPSAHLKGRRYDCSRPRPSMMI